MLSRTPSILGMCWRDHSRKTSQPFHLLQRQTFVARPHFCTLRGRVARPRFRTVLGRWRSCCAMSAAGEHMRHHGATTGSIEDPWRRIYRFAAIATTVSHTVFSQKNLQITERSVLHCVQMRQHVAASSLGPPSCKREAHTLPPKGARTSWRSRW